MKRTGRTLILLSLTVLVGSFGKPALPADAFKSLAQGVEYRHDVRAAGPLSIHVLRIDRQQKWDFQTGLGQGTVYGLEPLDGIVARVASQLKKPAVAAINGDFFVIKPAPIKAIHAACKLRRGNWSAGRWEARFGSRRAAS